MENSLMSKLYTCIYTCTLWYTLATCTCTCINMYIARTSYFVMHGSAISVKYTYITGETALFFRINFSGDDSDFYPYWTASVVGPVLHILAVVHAVLWGFPSSILGSIVSSLLYTFVPCQKHQSNANLYWQC